MPTPTDPTGDEPTETPAPDLEVPEDVRSLEDADLTTLHLAVRDAIIELRARADTDPGSVTDADVERAAELQEAFSRLQADIDRRAGEQDSRLEAIRSATDGVTPPAEDPAGTEPVESDPVDGEPVEHGEPVTPAPEAPAPEAPAGELVPQAAGNRRGTIRVPARPAAPTMNPSLGAIAAAQGNPGAAVDVRPELVLTAAAGIPNVSGNERLTDMAALADAFVNRALSMNITQGNGAPMPVASIQRRFEQTVDWDSPIEDVDAALEALIGRRGATREAMQGLVAAGGWCAPSEIGYDFFNVAGAPTGLVDLPTIGIRRGGIRWPFSLDLADFFGLSGAPASGTSSNATMPWMWTETDDMLAATGSPVKTCLRPPCPTFDEARLVVYGLCVLAGNLTEEAYPELIRHFLGLVNIAHARVMNRRHIATMVAHASVTGVTPTVGGASSLVTHVIGAAELIATHMRYKYGAPMNAVVEYALPAWARGAMRSDLAKRNGFDNLAVADAYLMSLFDARDIRVQWLEDWQSVTGWAAAANTIGAASPPTAWPTSFQGLMFFPGHFFRGNGMRLNLGVVRDSVLNETNDHTAAWSEEASLIGARGSEAFLITNSAIYPNGVTGAQATQAAASA